MRLNRKYRYMLLGIFCLMLLSINVFQVKGVENVEGNTSVRNAFEIPYLPFQLSINIQSSKEERWFKVELSNPGSLKLTPNSSSGLSCDIYSKEGLQNDTNPKPLTSDSYLDSDNYYKLDVGTYYVKVYPKYSNGGWKDKEIMIEWDLFEDDAYEPNENYQQATPVQLGEPMTIRFPGSNDIDWFKIKVDKSKALKLKSNDARVGYTIYTEEELKKDNPTAIKEGTLTSDYYYWKLDVGVYYIKMEPYNYDWKGKDIQITFDIFEDDSYEPNDSYRQATPIQLRETMTIRLSGENDIDWFKLQVDETISLNLKADDDYKELKDGSNNGIQYFIYSEEELKKSNPTPIGSNYLLENNQ